jgi:biopolymer transport protein ExbD
MKIKRGLKNAFPESSATSDMAFILIIYFIVIAGFNANKGLIMNLPAPDSSRFVAQDDIMRFELKDSGDIFFNGARKDIASIERDIRQGIALHPAMAVVLDVAPQAHWQNVVSFVELAEKLHVETFSFKMKPEALEQEAE